MKLKNISVGDSVQLKKRLVSNIFRKKQVCEVIKIDSEHEFRPDVLVKGEYCLGWVNHKDLKKPIQLEPEPKLKVLDQSVFSHPYVDDRFNYVALNADGQSIFFEQKPSVSVNLDIWVATGGSILPMLKGYDTTDWQNSLIERDDIAKELLEVDLSSELTGSELCLKLLNLDRDVMCDVKDGDYRLIFAHDGEFFISHNKGERECHERVTPINNQGEPLTAAEAGL